MEDFFSYLQALGVPGLLIISFLESFISPILPDILLIPLALSNPANAITYAALATLCSVLGGFIGYYIGQRWGIDLFHRKVPEKYTKRIEYWIGRYGGWAIFFASLAPIPYKFISISAGVFQVNWFVFTIASIFGRAKRFMLIGILIYFYGEKAVALSKEYSDNMLWGFGIFIVAAYISWKVYQYVKNRQLEKQEDAA